jgi:hypothetical protein
MIQKLKLIFRFLIVLSLLLFLAGVVAGLEVQTSTSLIGNGTVDHETEMNTHAGYEGFKYEDGYYTRSLGWWGPSNVNYTSEINLIASDKANSTIDVSTLFELTNVKQDASLRNYNIMASQSFKTDGDSVTAYSFTGDNHTSTFDMVQELLGCGKYKLFARNVTRSGNSTNLHTYEFLDKADYCGNFTLELSSFFGSPVYPAANMTEEEWLFCPHGSTFGDCKMGEP